MTKPVRAAQYVRMSTEHQRYSIAYQQQAIARHAQSRGYEVVETFCDAGRSGLTLKNRAGLKSLLSSVMSGTAEFSVVLVYDVSRWGRFQDPDEGAHYEFVCRSAGVRVEYAAEPFEDDGSLTAAILKTVKRAMAAEYVRELSAKVRAAKEGLGNEGYWTGGPTPYGYRRAMLTPDGTQQAILQEGEHKALQGHRSVLVAGPAAEVETVRRIFSLFVIHGLRPLAIADLLNAENVASRGGKPWTSLRVRNVLSSEKYVGVLVIGRYASFLKQQITRPRAQWRRVAGACPALVERGLWEAAQANLHMHRETATDTQLLNELRAAWKRHGRLSESILVRDPETRSGRVSERRFGSLTRAFELIGYERTVEQMRMLEKLRRDKPHLSRTFPNAYTAQMLLAPLKALLQARGRLTARLINESDGLPNSGTYRNYFGSLSRAYELVGYQPNAHQRERFRAIE